MFINCHSYYSLRFGTLSIEHLVHLGLKTGSPCLVLTDINSTTGVYDFILECKDKGIKPVIGIDFRTDTKQHFIGLAKNREGFRSLNQLITNCNFEKKVIPQYAPELPDTFVIYPLDNHPTFLRENEFIGIQIHEVNKLILNQLPKDKLVILHSVSFAGQEGFYLHQLLRAVNKNVLLTKLGDQDVASKNERFLLIDDLLAYYKHLPHIIQNTERLMDLCNFDFDFTTPKNKKYYTNNRYNDRLLLEQLALDGMVTRYGSNNKAAKERIQKEIEIIDQMGFAGYFLTTWDIVRYSISRGFHHVGRGSGANSIVSYCLNITNCDPLELNLYFERFLNPSRLSPPDFDIDWSWQTRDEILKYAFTRFNRECTAFAGTIGTFKHRSITRELGKVYGLPKEELDKLSKNPVESHQKDHIVSKIHHYGKQLEGFPNMRSLHACGILISEEPLTYYSALDMPPKGFPTVQFDMYIAEEIGFEKLDILSQRGIGHINDTVNLIEENQGKAIDIHQTGKFKKDPKLNKLLSIGKTIGCFYIESPAMRGLLRRLRCDTYEVLIAASSIIRPGVAQSGMMREYVFRHNHPDQFEFFHPVFEKELGDTYGVMVYQEDVIKIAHHFAGLDLAEADVFRRAMSGKTRSKKHFEEVKKKFFDNCKSFGYSEELSHEVYRQIESFAGYSFCKSHSASYAVESYQSLYLKTYFPLEFMVGVINNFGGFYRTEVYVHELRMAGGKINSPCVNKSKQLTSLEGDQVFLGFIHIESLPKQLRIEEERNSNGDYKSLEDFISRLPIGIQAIQTLIHVGAFRFTGKDKGELILESRLIFNHEKSITPNTLFQTPIKKFQLPSFERSEFEDAFDEIELLGFSVSKTPFELLQTRYRGDVMVKDLIHFQGKKVRMLGYLISRKFVPTKKGTMNFGTWVDVNGDYFDTTHFPRVFQQYPFSGGGCYLLLGTVDIDFGFPSVVVEKLARLPFIPDPRYPDDQEAAKASEQRIKADLSLTQRQPYPSEQEIGLPRFKMG